jgi:hypothetical protein
LVTAVLFGSLGIFWSTLMRRPMAATITTTAVNVALMFGIPFLVGVFTAIFLRDTPAWAGSPFFVYPWTAFLFLHPFIALGASDVLLSQGETRLFVPVEDSAFSGFVPGVSSFTSNFPLAHPWLIYTIEGLLLSALFIFLSVRMLKPLNEGAPKRKRRGAKA